MGGEAIKAFQYLQFLLQNGHDAYLMTHERCRDALVSEFPEDRMIFVPDTALMVFCWRSRGLNPLVNTLFHCYARRLCQRFNPAETILHYLCPISPMMQRFAPRGYRHVVGPLSGNIFYPPGFRERQGKGQRLQQRLYRPIQGFLGIVPGMMRKADRLLVSGGDRTRQALRWSRCDEARMMMVADAGVSERISEARPIDHSQTEREFVWIGRMVNYKGVDIAIRAVARSEQGAKLIIYGDGPEKPGAEALVHKLGLQDRVTFPGWLPHADYVRAMSRFRGFLFPTLAEANGIVMQEAMGLGLPVVALRWGGPTQLATDQEALFVEAADLDAVVDGFARAMDQLISDTDLAKDMSERARTRAMSKYTWPVVAESWMKSYDGLLAGR